MSFECALPKQATETIRLGHGSGGKLTAQLISNVFVPALGEAFAKQFEDAAIMPFGGNAQVAITTDSYVVKPYRFPGGDIGSLAVHGTVNDLAVRGAKPLYLSAAFIIEEGFPISEISLLMDSMKGACTEGGVLLVAADTKVVQKSACDKIFITTTGIGIVHGEAPPSVSRTIPGDTLVVSGQLGLHGMAVMCAREDLQFEHSLLSDSASMHNLAASVLAAHEIHSMRDITRGGLISVLCEIAEGSNVGIEIDESLIPIHPEVSAACELLGLDPLFVACEGRLVATAPHPQSECVVATMRKDPLGKDACTIGKVTDDHPGKVIMRSRIGGRRFLDKLSGDQLPRIC